MKEKLDCYPFWEQLKEKEKDELRQSIFVKSFPKGTILHRSKDECGGLMTLLFGQFRTYIVSEEGREVTLFRVNENEVCVLSASCLMDTIEFEVMIEAIEDTEALILPTHALNRLMQENPAVELYMYKAATEKFSEVMWTMQKILFLKMDQRIAAFLMEEARRRNQRELLLTHDEIARNIGSAREVVSKVLKYLEEQGMVELGRGKVIIKDLEELNLIIG